MANRTLPELASVEGFEWGLHHPKKGAASGLETSPALQQRLHCVLLDVLASTSLAATAHSENPYFTPPGLCWHTIISDETSPGTQDTFKATHHFPAYPPITKIEVRICTRMGYSLVPGEKLPIFAYIEVDLRAYDDKGQIPSLLDASGQKQLPTEYLEWKLPKFLSMDKKLFSLMSWECLAAIINRLTKLDYYPNGAKRDLLVDPLDIHTLTNPLVSVGYHGWPGIWPREDLQYGKDPQRPSWAVFRKTSRPSQEH